LHGHRSHLMLGGSHTCNIMISQTRVFCWFPGFLWGIGAKEVGSSILLFCSQRMVVAPFSMHVPTLIRRSLLPVTFILPGYCS